MSELPDMTPPPMKTWAVVVDSPFIPKHECEVEARVEAEAQVYGAEAALAAAPDRLTAPALKRITKMEDRVTTVANCTTATIK